MKEQIKKFRRKYIERFKEAFVVPYTSIIEKIDLILENFLNESISEMEATSSLKELTKDFEFTPFKWILHHIRIDHTNIELANQLIRSNPSAIVYKNFEFQEYGMNLFNAIYQKRISRIRHEEKRAKLFWLKTLLENENLTSSKLPKITTTIFEDHKHHYDIYDWGILTVYNKGDIWNKTLKRYVSPKTNFNNDSRRFSFSFSMGENNKIVKNTDGSFTTFDDQGNTETIMENGCIETRLKDGEVIFEYPDGSLTKQDKEGVITEFDFEGIPIIKIRKSKFWKKIFKL